MSKDIYVVIAWHFGQLLVGAAWTAEQAEALADQHALQNGLNRDIYKVHKGSVDV